MGCLLPVWHQRSPNVLPRRCSFVYPCPKTRLLEHASPGVQPSFMVYSKTLSCASRPRTTLMGFLSPSTHTGHRSPRLLRLRGKPPDQTRKSDQDLPAGPDPPATVPLTGFLNLSATCSSCRPPTIFRQVAFMGFALQGFDPLTKTLPARHHQITLLPLLPPVAQLQVLGPKFPLGARSAT